MKKIMFNDQYGLTRAVLNKQKTMTRRVALKEPVPNMQICWNVHTNQLMICSGYDIVARSQFSCGEVVAIAQSYEQCEKDAMAQGGHYLVGDYLTELPGYKNKMFVKARYMPHTIHITDIRVERLQDITNGQCLEEGVLQSDKYAMPYGIPTRDGVFFYYSTPREAFAALIDKVSGKGTWDSNPLVWVYEFERFD